jgi:hypothetical protein
VPHQRLGAIISTFFFGGSRELSISTLLDRLSGEAQLKRLEDSMRYLCLIYDNEAKMSEMQKTDGDAIMKEYGAFTEEIKTSGKYIAGEALHRVSSATTLRVRNGKLSTTDGPFAETKEQLGGFYLIDATDLNDAIRIASKIPSVRTGSIEVRPVVDFSKTTSW